MKVFIVALAFAFASTALAQNASDVNNGRTFANSIAPISQTQIVNPAGVNASAWAGQTNMPTSVPSGFAAFSNPNTSSAALTAARGSSLTALGNQAQIDCAAFVPGNDPYQNQYCAAVNFLNNQCMQPTTGQKSVLGKTGQTISSNANCAGTFGAGQSQFGYGDQVTIDDPMFKVILGLGDSAQDALSTICTPKTVVTQPAQYENNTCVVSIDKEENVCSQYLNATITNSISQALSVESCPDGMTLQGGMCLHQVTYTPWISCPAGYIQSGANRDQCVQISNLQGTPYCPGGFGTGHTDNGTMVCVSMSSYPDPPPNVLNNMPLIDRGLCIGGSCYNPSYLPLQSCPDGYTFDGTQCTKTTTVGATYSCPNGGALQGQTCVTNDSANPTVTYSCPPGQTLNGSNCVKQVVKTSWTDTCTAYEQSAGVALPTPAN
ncbi:hypothetical protein KTE60_16055 [Burkholderia multivorans]|uniref:hypothetical protein n=1 Tax=Burkholderia multivorans TaxID=87883 RepID=UPI001C243F47|nr:hypothetical protein [Burkholderia multivorans]MBU9630800.1 hypothetical protein [Burkholderia multivorans]